MNVFSYVLLLVLSAVIPALAVEPSDGPNPSTSAVKKFGAKPLCFVFAGESNSGGFGLNTEATAAELAPRSCVQIMNLTSGKFEFENLQIGVNNLQKHGALDGLEKICHGFELELANAVEKGTFAGHKQVYLIKTGQGGSRVKDWNPEHPNWKNSFLQRVQAGKRQLPGNVQWVVWLSLGINDGRSNTPDFKTLMSEYLDRVHAELPGAVIVMTGFESMGYPTINQILHQLAAEKTGVATVDTTGAALAKRRDRPDLVDPNHWGYAGLKVVTTRLIESTQQALKRKSGVTP
jgi:hypothetical protein